MGGGGGQADVAQKIGSVQVVAQGLTGVSGRDLPALIDEHKARLGSGIVVLIADAGGKAAVAAGVTDDLKEKLSAVDLVRSAVEALGGKGGGGRADLAQGGAPSADNIDEALEVVRAKVKEVLS